MRTYDATRPWRPVEEPGIYDGIPNDAYHSDLVPGGSLSSSGAKSLLDHPPARFHYERTHRPDGTRAQNLGSAAHTIVLGEGDKVVTVPTDSYRTAGARDMRDACLARGEIPVLEPERATVDAMAKALATHHLAPLLFSTGRPEQSAFWYDDEFNVWRRARFDYLPDVVPGRPLIVPDYKTSAVGADPVSFGKTVANFGYAMQADWYLSALAALGVATDAAFLFVVQETQPPYLVNVLQLPQTALLIGRHRNRKALRIYADGQATGHWPGYTGVHEAELPSWFIYANQEALHE